MLSLQQGRAQLVRVIDDLLRPLGNQEIAAAESPAYADAGDLRVAGGRDVHLGIAHVDALARRGAERVHRGEYGVRGRLAGDARGFSDRR